jgi:hypothetical protein
MEQIYGYNNETTSPQATKFLYYFMPAFCLALINVIMFVYICKIVSILCTFYKALHRNMTP